MLMFFFFEFQVTDLFSTYILNNKHRFLDMRNVKLAIVDGDILGDAFGVKAFHRCQVNDLLRGQLIPYNPKRDRTGSEENPTKRIKIEIDKLEPENRKVFELLSKQIQKKKAHLECPVCYETVSSSPIFMCSQMHLICLSCYPRLKKCPECREKYKKIARRHRYAEKDVDELRSMQEELLKIAVQVEVQNGRVEDKRQCETEQLCSFCGLKVANFSKLIVHHHQEHPTQIKPDQIDVVRE